ncbi:MAG: trypsin-like peptidase domain-containing protein, partial [Pseudonocardia sp.]|nr:trypsin-like peptidase domain-containing protein [Pseudonocardia sp.]
MSEARVQHLAGRARAAAAAGFTTILRDGHPALVLHGPAGVLVISGELLRTAPGVLHNPLSVLELLALLAARWAPAHIQSWSAEQRADWLARTLADGWRAATPTDNPHGQVWVHPLGDSGFTAVTIPQSYGRHLLVGVHPTTEGMDLARVNATAATARRSVLPVHHTRHGFVGTAVATHTANGLTWVRTALHVIEGANPRELTVDGKRVVGWTVLGLDQYGPDEHAARAAYQWQREHGWHGDTLDIAELIVSDLDAPPAPQRHTPPRLGEPVLVIGYPSGRPAVALGTVDALEAGHLSTAVFFGPGMSGGGVFDLDGNQIGTAIQLGIDDATGLLHAVGPTFSASFNNRHGGTGTAGYGAAIADASRGPHGRAGGELAVGEWRDADTELLLRILPHLAPYLVSMRDSGYRMPRGPPEQWVLDEARALPVLRGLATKGELTEAEFDRASSAIAKLVTFAWRDPDVPLAAGGVVVTTRGLQDELAGHVAAGRLTKAQVRAWWRGEVLPHEWRHLFGPDYTEDEHRLDTTITLAPLVAARVAAAVVLDPADPHRRYVAAPAAGVIAERKPHGSALDEGVWRRRRSATGTQRKPEELKADAGRLAAALRDVVAPEEFREQFRVLSGWVAEIERLLRGRDLANGPTPTVRFYRLENPFIDPETGLTLDAFSVTGDREIRVFYSDVAGLVHELVESWFARGLPEQVRHTVAVLAERVVEAPRFDQSRWLTGRAVWEIERLAVHDEMAWASLVAGYDDVVADIEARFAELPFWRDLVKHYAAQFHAEAASPLTPQVDNSWTWDSVRYNEAYERALRDLPFKWKEPKRVYSGRLSTRLGLARRHADRGRFDRKLAWRIAETLRQVEEEAHLAGLKIPDDTLLELSALLVAGDALTRPYDGTYDLGPVHVRDRGEITKIFRGRLVRYTGRGEPSDTKAAIWSTAGTVRELLEELRRRSEQRAERREAALFLARGGSMLDDVEAAAAKVQPEPEPLVSGDVLVEGGADDPFTGATASVDELSAEELQPLAVELDGYAATAASRPTSRAGLPAAPWDSADSGPRIAEVLAEIARLMRGQPTSRPEPVTVRFYRLRRPLTDPVSGRSTDAHATLVGAGTLAVYFSDLPGLTRALTERWFAPDELSLEEATTFAAQTERAVARELTTTDAAQVADEMAARPVPAPFGFPDLFDALRGYLDTAIRLLRGGPVRPAGAEHALAGVRLIRWDRPATTPGGQPVPYDWDWTDGELTVWFVDQPSLVSGLVEAWLGRWDFPATELAVIADLVQRAVAAPARQPLTWLTVAEVARLAELAEQDPDAWAALIRTENESTAGLFTDRPDIQALLKHYARERRAQAASRITPVHNRLPRSSVRRWGLDANHYGQGGLMVGLRARDLAAEADRAHAEPEQNAMTTLLEQASELLDKHERHQEREHYERLHRRLHRALGLTPTEAITTAMSLADSRTTTAAGEPTPSADGPHYLRINETSLLGVEISWVRRGDFIRTFGTHKDTDRFIYEDYFYEIIMADPHVRFYPLERPLIDPNTGRLIETAAVWHGDVLYAFSTDIFDLMEDSGTSEDEYNELMSTGAPEMLTARLVKFAVDNPKARGTRSSTNETTP